MPIDYSTYHYKWKLISYFIRHYRAKEKCEWCGVENGEPHPITGSTVILTVAHIDQDKRNNRFYNLAALCQRCHLGHDKYQHARNRKYGRNHKENQLELFPSPSIKRQLMFVPIKIIQFNAKSLIIKYIERIKSGHNRDILNVNYLITRNLKRDNRDSLVSRNRDSLVSLLYPLNYLIIRGIEIRVSRFCPEISIRITLIINHLPTNWIIFSGTHMNF